MALSLCDEETALLQNSPTKKDIQKMRSQSMQRTCFVGLCGIGIGMLVMILLGGNHRSASHKSNSYSDTFNLHTQRAKKNKKNFRYAKFQGLGFQIYTGGAPAFIEAEDKKMIENPECSDLNSYGHAEHMIACYLGHKDNSIDVKKRLEVMTQAVERAYEVSDKSSSTLKIFLAPEFFFRGADGAYLYTNRSIIPKKEGKGGDDCGAVCEILAGLETLVAQKKFEDWLFVFGTIVASEVLPEVEDLDYKYLFYNFAPVYKGYDPAHSDFTGKRFMVPKRYVSNEDFLTPERHFNDSLAKEIIHLDGQPSNRTVLNPFEFHWKHYDDQIWNDYAQEIQKAGYTMIDYAWFILDDITLSIEICLDHDVRTALNTYLADAVSPKPVFIPRFDTSSSRCAIEYVPIPKHQADISLVASAGMTVNMESMALTDHGTVFLQDGSSGAKQNMTWVSDDCGSSWHFEGGTEMVQRWATISKTEALFEYQVSQKYKQYQLYHENKNEEKWKNALRGVFSRERYEPKITVYEPINIAHSFV